MCFRVFVRSFPRLSIVRTFRRVSIMVSCVPVTVPVSCVQTIPTCPILHCDECQRVPSAVLLCCACVVVASLCFACHDFHSVCSAPPHFSSPIISVLSLGHLCSIDVRVVAYHPVFCLQIANVYFCFHRRRHLLRPQVYRQVLLRLSLQPRRLQFQQRCRIVLPLV